MKMIFKSVAVIGGFVLLGGVGVEPVRGDVAVQMNVDTAHPGTTIPDDFAGLSYETSRELPDAAGKYYFNGQNAALVQMFRTLGIKNLRIGGNTVDNSKVAIPAQADIDSLFQFAKAADTKVIYSFRLKAGDPQGSAAQAQAIASAYAANLCCFSIGNEPDIYVHSYNGFLKGWLPIYDAINASVPNAKFCGPSLTSNAQSWSHDFARDYYPKGKILYITQHEYAGGAGGKVKDPVLGRDAMLSPQWQATYQTYFDKFVPPLQAMGAPYRLEEANNFYNGGAVDVSDSFASALWGLDYLYWWASHGALGVNFHNGDEVAAGPKLTVCRYASFTTAPDGYLARPLAYAIKVFTLGGHGQIVPSTVMPDASAADLNLAGYAVMGADKTLYVTLINKEHGATGREAEVTIHADAAGYTHGQSMALVAPGGDVAAKEGLLLGNSPIHDDGSWQETWTDLPAPTSAGNFSVKVPPGSILLVRLKGN